MLDGSVQGGLANHADALDYHFPSRTPGIQRGPLRVMSDVARYAPNGTVTDAWESHHAEVVLGVPGVVLLGERRAHAAVGRA